MDDLAFRTAVDLAAALRRRELSSRELLDHCLARIDRLNPRINAVVTVDAEGARRRAGEADAALARGESWGPLHGLQMTVKDTYEVAGMRTTAGAPELADYVPTTDAVAVSRLRAAGAIVFGKTNTPLYAGDAQSYNAVFGTTNNPWDVTRGPGGSSGGSAAALAAGLVPLELGSDIGGSVRNPAHFCGVYGHKPTWGIVPPRGHIPGPPGSLSEVDLGVMGPMARSARDLAAALDVLAGPDAARAVAWKLDLPKPRRNGLREYRVAAWLDDADFPVDREVRAVHEAAVEALRRAGVRVDDRARPIDSFVNANHRYQKLLWPILSGGLPAEQFESFARYAAEAPATEDNPILQFARAATLRHREWLSHNEWREHYRARWASFFEDFDVLLCPIAPTPAIPHDHSEPLLERTILVNGQRRPYWDLIAWAGIVTMALLPATVAPVGRTPSGLPVGIQIVGPFLEDRTPIDFAGRMAEVVGGFEAPPGY